VRRRLVTVLSWTPLALCLLLCWISFHGGLFGLNDGFARDVIRPEHLDRLRYGFRTRRNGLEISWHRDAYRDPVTFRQQTIAWQTRTWGGEDLRPNFDKEVYPRLARLGFALSRRQFVAPPGIAVSDWAVRIPWWALAALMLALHSITTARGLRAQRGINWQRVGRCGACGYDLRASASQCPECGATMPTQVATVA
jgi:hypothetical protein